VRGERGSGEKHGARQAVGEGQERKETSGQAQDRKGFRASTELFYEDVFISTLFCEE
jgi:hypothetical protein